MKWNNTQQQTAAAGLFKLLLNPNVSQSGTQKKVLQHCSIKHDLSYSCVPLFNPESDASILCTQIYFFSHLRCQTEEDMQANNMDIV